MWPLCVTIVVKLSTRTHSHDSDDPDATATSTAADAGGRFLCSRIRNVIVAVGTALEGKLFPLAFAATCRQISTYAKHQCAFIMFAAGILI